MASRDDPPMDGRGWPRMMTDYDRWAFARLLAVDAINGKLDAVSPPYKRLADRLAALPLVDRDVAFEAYLFNHSEEDACAIRQTVADKDPLGPAPQDLEAQLEGWPPLRFKGMPPVKPFPAEVLPEAAARIVQEGAAAIGCSPDFLGVLALSVAAGTIGRSVSLRLKSSYFAPSNLFAGCIGPPSDGKTPALKVVTKTVRDIDKILELEHQQAMERWDEESSRTGPDGKKLKQAPPPKPKPRRIDVDDITMEAVPLILADNPRGLIMIRDELSALLLGMNQYKGGKGNDRAVLLKIWSGDAITKDRVAHENNMPIRCRYPCMTIVGGLTPDMLGSLADPQGRADGFVDRFLFCYPDPLPAPLWSDSGVPDETSRAWSDLVFRLWSRGMNLKDGQTVPHVAKFTKEGLETWEGLYNDHTDEMNRDDFPPNLRGPWGKFRDHSARLTLILACLHRASDPTADIDEPILIGPDLVRDAWRLAGYFKSHARRVHASIASLSGSGIGGGDVVKTIVDWLRNRNRLSFTKSELQQARRWIKEDDRDAAMAYLVGQSVIRLQQSPPGPPKVGQPKSPVYEVNPSLLVTENAENTENCDQEGNSKDSQDSQYELGGVA